MAERFSAGEINLDVLAGRKRPPATADAETPFLIAVLGDFSGRANRGMLERTPNWAKRRLHWVDRDNFEEVLAKLSPGIELPLDGMSLSLRFQELDDFHPDRIFERAVIFQKLRQMRERLSDPASFPQVLSELGVKGGAGGTPPQAEPGTSPRAASSDVRQMASGDLLARAIDETHEQSPARAESRPDELRAFVRRIMQPHLAAKDDPRRTELVTVLDRATSEQMRALLHVPDFQELEGIWRALYFLVRRIQTDERLKVCILDIAKPELAADLSARDLRASGLYNLFAEQGAQTPGAQPWSLVVGSYTFEPTCADAELLASIAKVAEAAGAAFLAGASPRVLSCDSIEELSRMRGGKPQGDAQGAAAWNALRGLPESRYVGLVLPRFLLRLPYGAETDRTERFDFEELSTPPVHEDYLWGNSAFALAVLLAEAFRSDGWGMNPNSALEIDGLPLHVYRENGESCATPCAEVLLTQDVAEEIVDRGVMPLASYKNQDKARLLRFQSIAEPLSPLAGRWA